MMTPAHDEGFTYPSSLREVVAERIPDYEIGLTWSEYTDRPEAFRADLDDLLSNRRELMRLLLSRTDWRLFSFVYTAPDRLQHLLWDDDVRLKHYRRPPTARSWPESTSGGPTRLTARSRPPTWTPTRPTEPTRTSVTWRSGSAASGTWSDGGPGLSARY